MAQTAREASLARRLALSSSGKAAISGNADRTRIAPGTAAATPAPSTAATASYTPAPATSNQGGNAREAALARRIAMSQGGKRAVGSTDRIRNAPATAAPAPASATTERKEGCGCGCGGKNKAETAPAVDTTVDTSATMTTPVVTAPVQMKKVDVNPTRAAALSRRIAMSSKGKSALKGGTVSEASAARAANPTMSSRELAQTLRTQRSEKGKTNKTQKSSTAATGPGRHRKAAEDAPWKVGATETASGQTVTGTMVDRTNDVTGNEASTCRAVTGTEYMGADVFQDFCQKDAKPGFNRVSVTSTGSGNSVSGNKVGRSSRVTGDEPGTCKAVTGTEYVSADQMQSYCGTSGTASPSKFSIAETMKGKPVSGNNAGTSGKVTGNESGADRSLTGTQYMQKGEDMAPAKVSASQTLRGGSVTGQHVGRSEKVTGDEPGACKHVTGDDYVGAEQYGSCNSAPAPTDRKVGLSGTLMGKSVTGTMTDRADNVTGSEAGICKALTGTPYSGEEQTEAFCSSPDKAMSMARARKGTGNVGPAMTGIQPGIGGVMTGAGKGACEPLTGTPYIGADQAAGACPATAATTASPDFPQQLAGQPWGDFSVSQPSGGAQQGQGANMGNVTGSSYESGHITGPFGMAGGKVTGTEEARFGGDKAAMPEPVAVPAAIVEGRVKSRITGEGQDAGQKITGDDWERGDHVTGTEGTSATRRNPTRRGPVAAMAVDNKRNEEVTVPVSKVTGSSGNTEQGSLITYSGGARG